MKRRLCILAAMLLFCACVPAEAADPTATPTPVEQRLSETTVEVCDKAGQWQQVNPDRAQTENGVLTVRIEYSAGTGFSGVGAVYDTAMWTLAEDGSARGGVGETWHSWTFTPVLSGESELIILSARAIDTDTLQADRYLVTVGDGGKIEILGVQYLSLYDGGIALSPAE